MPRGGNKKEANKDGGEKKSESWKTALAFHFAVCLRILQGRFAARVCVRVSVCAALCVCARPLHLRGCCRVGFCGQRTSQPPKQSHAIASHRVYATWSHHSIKTLTAVNGFSAHPQNAIRRWSADDFAAAGAKNAGPPRQFVGPARLCGVL